MKLLGIVLLFMDLFKNIVGQLYNGLKITLAFWTNVFFPLSLQIANDSVHQSLLNNFFFKIGNK